MRLDLRLPIGLMFTAFGAMLTVFGIVSDRAIYDRSLGINVNLWWGLVLLVFGLVMLAFALPAELTRRRSSERHDHTEGDTSAVPGAYGLPAAPTSDQSKPSAVDSTSTP